MGAREALTPDPVLAEFLAALRQAAAAVEARAWLVGGSVRDRLLGRPNPDFDVVVEDGLGGRVAETFARQTGSPEPVLFERFGTAQVRWRGHLVEFASARAESYREDSRKPDVGPATLADDLRRRDFTVNTLLMDLDANVIDPLGEGLSDLERGVLRTPRPPAETFKDDPLRMLRAVRFAAQLGFELDPALLPAMREMRGRLAPPVLSVERTADELRKMLLSERPRLALELMEAGGLLEIVLPEVHACRGVEQRGWHRWDVYGHTLEAVEKAKPDLTVRLAALLHDVGKPVTATPDGAFHGHDSVGAEMASVALKRLRFSNAEAARVSKLVRLHLRPVFYDSEWTDGAVRRLARAAGPLLWPLLDLARADIAASAYPHPEKLDELADRLRGVLAERPSRVKPAVSGRDLMAALGLKPGPEVGRIKALIEDLVLEGELEPDRDAVLEYARAHAADLLRG
ncbi:MAG TPA: HD domain-containing protein [Candidatus Dormibacteraeota bacterium]